MKTHRWVDFRKDMLVDLECATVAARLCVLQD